MQDFTNIGSNGASSFEEYIDPKSIKLYKPSAIPLATFLGSVIAGGFVAYLNFSRLGQKTRGLKILMVCALVTILILGSSFVPQFQNLPNSFFYIPQIIVMSFLSGRWFQKVTKNHVEAGREMESNWKAAGIGVLSMTFLFGIIMAFVFSFPDYFPA